jgi:hypothetical protein
VVPEREIGPLLDDAPIEFKLLISSPVETVEAETAEWSHAESSEE